MRSYPVRSMSLRFAVVAALLVGALAFTTVAFAPSDAEAACWGVTVYYNNAAHSQVVGARGTGCCGEVINWGTTSPYHECEVIYCLDVICPQYQ